MTTKAKLANEDLYIARKNICMTCEYFHESIEIENHGVETDICSLCNCKSLKKAEFKDQACPLRKW